MHILEFVRFDHSQQFSQCRFNRFIHKIAFFYNIITYVYQVL